MSALHICSTLHTANGPRHTVLIDGEIYTINHHLLAALRAGDTVEDLGLEPDDAAEDDDTFGIPSPDGLRLWHNSRVI